MEYRGLYVSATPDCEPNDNKHWGKVNIDGSYRYYVENGVISPENSDI